MSGCLSGRCLQGLLRGLYLSALIGNVSSAGEVILSAPFYRDDSCSFLKRVADSHIARALHQGRVSHIQIPSTLKEKPRAKRPKGWGEFPLKPVDKYLEKKDSGTSGQDLVPEVWPDLARPVLYEDPYGLVPPSLNRTWQALPPGAVRSFSDKPKESGKGGVTNPEPQRKKRTQSVLLTHPAPVPVPETVQNPKKQQNQNPFPVSFPGDSSLMSLF